MKNETYLPLSTTICNCRHFVLSTIALLAGGLLLGLPTSCLAVLPAQSRPNIIHLLSDDQGWGDVSYSQDRAPGDTFAGDPILQTPNLEEMRAAGLSFNRFYAAAPVCSPTRASILTGRNGARAGIPNALGTGADGKIRNREITIAELAKTQGYATGHFGKWHVGTVTKHTYDFRRGRQGNYAHYSAPWNSGYDTSFAFEGNMPTFDPYDAFPIAGSAQSGYFTGPSDGDLTTRVPNDSRIDDKHEAEIITDQALDFMEQAADNEKPFLMTLWFSAPHTPLLETPVSIYDGLGLSSQKRRYFESITKMDEQIGRVRSKLVEMGIAEDTLLMFSSDNGPADASADGWGSTGGLRGQKWDTWEGGIRVPALMEWKNQIDAGRTTDAIGTTDDILPTLLDVWGISMPDNRTLDGSSLRKVIDGTDSARDEDYRFYSKYFAELMVMDNRYKLVTTSNGSSYGLFDLLADPDEDSSVANSLTVHSQPPEIQSKFSELLAALENWKTEIEISAGGADFETRIVSASATANIRADAETTLPLESIGTDPFGGVIYEDKYQITGSNPAFQASGEVSVFLESQYSTLTADLAVNSDGTPGIYADPALLPTGLSIPSGTVVHSFLLHHNPTGDESVTVTLEFDDPVLGVIAAPELLEDSDFLAFAEPVFETGQTSTLPGRGTLFAENSDGGWTLAADGRTLTVDFTSQDSDYDQLRVLTLSSLQLQPLLPLTADFNEDGFVNGADFLIWQNGLGNGAAFSQGDANLDQVVDAGDLAIWQAQYGQSTASISNLTVVPEPISLTLFLLGFIRIISPRRSW